MIIVMNLNSTEKEINTVQERLVENGFSNHLIHGESRLVIGAVGDRRIINDLSLERMSGVEQVISIMKPYKLVSREGKKENSIINIKGVEIGGNDIVVIAGPCAVENKEQLLGAAEAIKTSGAKILRGGAFKPRTSPYSFQGLELEGLKLLYEVSNLTGLPTVTEIIDEESLNMSLEYVDMIQVGARNMQNFKLLQLVGRSGKPVLLKRGMSATIEEWLMAAEYIASEGNMNIILCERGIRTFETATRNTLDISAVPVVKKLSHLPIIVDPSHATGDPDLIEPMSLAAIASGADGLIIEVHPEPKKALCDGKQSLNPDSFKKLSENIKLIAKVMGR